MRPGDRRRQFQFRVEHQHPSSFSYSSGRVLLRWWCSSTRRVIRQIPLLYCRLLHFLPPATAYCKGALLSLSDVYFSQCRVYFSQGVLCFLVHFLVFFRGNSRLFLNCGPHLHMSYDLVLAHRYIVYTHELLKRIPTRTFRGAMIKFVLMVNKMGQTRVSSYYDWMPIPERVALEAEVVRRCFSRSELQCSFFEFRGYKIIYRRVS